ncbi:MAG: DUF929 domain-containing protein [Candidatus Marsarchaeota archaeon]|jgi:Domain of unknown function (DUF929).|nr:DUF929 domain-containing protein [Candidatus Marsarchaeota archaeon]
MKIEKNKMMYIVVAAVVVLVAIAYVYSITYGSSSPTAALINQAVPQSELSSLKTLAANNSLADSIGFGSASNFPTPTGKTYPPIVVGGKATVVYVGADFCPYCAVTRWGLIVALMRFGNFTSLHYMASSATDVFPDTPTFTFYNSSYSSTYIDFMSVETTTRNETPLGVPNGIENATITKFDSSGGIPFIDFGNKTVQNGAEVVPSTIDKYTWSQIISESGNPNSGIAKGIIGSANIFTAEICSIDNFTPATVCNQPYVKSILKIAG